MRVGGELRGREFLAIMSSGTDIQVGVTQECRETQTTGKSLRQMATCVGCNLIASQIKEQIIRNNYAVLK